MATYEKDTGTLKNLAAKLIAARDNLQPLRNVRIDYLFAFGARDKKTDRLTGDAIRQHGVRALGLCSVVSLKDRVKGLGDVEILIDHDWWQEATEPQRLAVLHHELWHITVVDVEKDDIGRPKIALRQHDVQVGWFYHMAEVHGEASQESLQFRSIVEESGQLLFPELNDLRGGQTRMRLVANEVSSG